MKNYSGYYVFDSLWIKINEIGDKYIYFFALFDVKQYTLVDYKIVEEENSKTVHDFLRDATCNQPRILITTNLHFAYRKFIQYLNINFVNSTQNRLLINIFINHVKKNKLTEKEHREYKKYLKEIYVIYEAKDRFEVLDILNNLS